MKNSLIFLFLLSIASYSSSHIRDEYIQKIESPEGRMILSGDWLYLIGSSAKELYKRDEIFIEKNPEINPDRIHLTYRIKEESYQKLLDTRAIIGCRRALCEQVDITITEYKMDCLSLEYQVLRYWRFGFYFYPDQIIGGTPSMQRAAYYGEHKNTVKSWNKIGKNNINQAIENALCKKVLPTRNSEK